MKPLKHSKNKTPVIGSCIPVGCETKTRYVFWLFFKIGLCSATPFKRCRRELPIDVADHRSILKNKGVMRIVVIFQGRPFFSHINGKLSPRAFE